MQEYHVTLKNEKLRSYNRISWFIILILTLVYSYFAFFNGDQSHLGRKISLIIGLAIAMMLKVYFEKTRYRFGSNVFFYLLILGFIGNEFYLLAGIAFFFDLFHMVATRKKIVTISKDKIRYPTFPARNINWNSLNNVLLKDGLLTIDSKNDKVIQQLIEEDKTKIDENEFNGFCREQLRKSGPWKDEPGPGIGEVIHAISEVLP